MTSHSDLVSEEVEKKKVEIPRPSVSRDWTSHKQEIMIVPYSYCKASSISITVLQLTNIIICNVLFFKINQQCGIFFGKRNFFLVLLFCLRSGGCGVARQVDEGDSQGSWAI